MPENSKAGTVVLLAKKILAVDPDTVDREGVTLQLYGKDSDKFSLDPRTGEVVLATEPLDREEKEVASLIHSIFIPLNLLLQVYYLRLRATDTSGQQGEGQLVIHVTDRNDHQPKFLKLQVSNKRPRQGVPLRLAEFLKSLKLGGLEKPSKKNPLNL